MPGARVRTWFDVGSARTRHVPMNRLCVRRCGGGHTQDLLDRHSEVIFSFNLLFEPPDLLASSQGFILTTGLKRITNEEQLRLQADFCKMCEGSAVGRCPGAARPELVAVGTLSMLWENAAGRGADTVSPEKCWVLFTWE